THLLGSGPAVVVRAHPAHQLAGAGEGAPLVAEATLHDLVQAAGARGDVVVHDQAQQAVALEGDGLVALLLDELAEELVARLEQDVRAVGGLAQSEQPGPGREQPPDGSGVNGMGGGFDSNGHTLNSIVELTIESLSRFSEENGAKPSKR